MFSCFSNMCDDLKKCLCLYIACSVRTIQKHYLSTHKSTDTGKVVCPVLRAYTCPIWGTCSTGPPGHRQARESRKSIQLNKINFLGFDIDSKSMIVKLTQEKDTVITEFAQHLLAKRKITVKTTGLFHWKGGSCPPCL